MALHVCFSAEARADGPVDASRPASAEALFYEGRALMKERRYDVACAKLEESLQRDYGIGTEFNLADCHEKQGKIASAWAGFVRVATAARAASQLERERIAQRRAASLEPRLPRLTIDVPGAPAGLEVQRDGVRIASASWGTPLPLDPGPHRITATVPGQEPWGTDTIASEGVAIRVAVPSVLGRVAVPSVLGRVAVPSVLGRVAVPSVLGRGAVPRVEGGAETRHAPTAATASANTGWSTSTNNEDATAPATTRATTGNTVSTGEFTKAFPEPIVEQRGGTQRVVGWIATGLGIAGLGVSVGFGIDSLLRRDQSTDHCMGDLCDARGVHLRDDALRSGNVATVSALAGGTALAGGILLLVTTPRRATKETQKHTPSNHAPHVAIVGAGLMVQVTLP